MARKSKFASLPVIPIILAAGGAPRLGFPHALAKFTGRTAVEIAVANCIGARLRKPVVVLGWQAALVRRAVPTSALIVVNRHWREAMLSSIRAGLRRVPHGAAFLLYPVDLPLLTPAIVQGLARAFLQRRSKQAIVSPVHRGRAGHPVIFAPELRGELLRARTARNLVEKDPRRLKLIPVRSSSIYRDFDTPEELSRVAGIFLRRKHALATTRRGSR